jgi:hypothetical protein
MGGGFLPLSYQYTFFLVFVISSRNISSELVILLNRLSQSYPSPFLSGNIYFMTRNRLHSSQIYPRLSKSDDNVMISEQRGHFISWSIFRYLVFISIFGMSSDANGVIFVDTENTFRAERVHQIAESRGLDVEEVMKKILHIIA